jgi:hypothetical protein
MPPEIKLRKIIVIEKDPSETPPRAATEAPSGVAGRGKADDDCYLREGTGECFYCTGPETD